MAKNKLITHPVVKDFWDGFWLTMCLILVVGIGFVWTTMNYDNDRLATIANECVDKYNTLVIETSRPTFNLLEYINTSDYTRTNLSGQDLREMGDS